MNFKLIKLVFTFILIFTNLSYSYFDKIKMVDNIIKSGTFWSFYYSIEPFDNNTIGTGINYENFFFTLSSRYFGDFHILDEYKNDLGVIGIYDIYSELGYKNILLGNLDYYISIFGRYEYYFSFSEIYLGSRIGLCFNLGSIHLFGSIKFDDLVYFEGIYKYSFNENIKAKVFFNINYYYQDIFGSLSSTILDHNNFSIGVESGIFYGTLKGINPLFSLYLNYKNFSIRYDITFWNTLEIFQLWNFELNI
ncbi:MAG: hypothetical protein ACK4F9_07780 [Brevinematia bacterium]